jgi:flagellar operon protein
MVENVGRIDQTIPVQPNRGGQPGRVDGKGFQRVLDGSLRLSKHVSQRVDRRQLDLGPDRMRMIENAVDKAAAKGARESLVLLDNLALVVSVRNRTVITAMDRNDMKEGVFTQIDSAIIV